MEETSKTLFKNKYYTLEYLSEKNILIINAQGVPNLESIQKAWLKALEIAEEYKILRWLNNEREVKVLSSEGTKWFKESWFPMAVDKLRYQGINYTAVVVSDRFYTELSSKMSVDAMHKTQEQRFGKSTMVSKSFKSYEEALQWLLQAD